ncbi:hypothetical protein D3C73_1082770 [compost metagenome]
MRPVHTQGFLIFKGHAKPQRIPMDVLLLLCYIHACRKCNNSRNLFLQLQQCLNKCIFRLRIEITVEFKSYKMLKHRLLNLLIFTTCHKLYYETGKLEG